MAICTVLLVTSIVTAAPGSLSGPPTPSESSSGPSSSSELSTVQAIVRARPQASIPDVLNGQQESSQASEPDVLIGQQERPQASLPDLLIRQQDLPLESVRDVLIDQQKGTLLKSVLDLLIDLLESVPDLISKLLTSVGVDGLATLLTQLLDGLPLPINNTLVQQAASQLVNMKLNPPVNSKILSVAAVLGANLKLILTPLPAYIKLDIIVLLNVQAANPNSQVQLCTASFKIIKNNQLLNIGIKCA